MSSFTISLDRQWQRLQDARKNLASFSTLSERLAWLKSQQAVQEYLQSAHPLASAYSALNLEEEWCVCSLAFLEQGPIVFNPHFFGEIALEELKPFLASLWEIEVFYDGIGGLLGYHAEVLKHLLKIEEKEVGTHTQIRQPQGVSFLEEESVRAEAVEWGIEAVAHLGEIYVVGGAGDRLDLRDPVSENPLPAAMLPFTGRTLIEGLIRDLEAREALYTKKTGNPCITPIALMTSPEKDNHHYLTELFAQKNWFNRPQKSFFFFQQPLVPVITEEGNWSLQGPLQLTKKPGGHGVLWRLAKEAGVYDWFRKQGREKVFVRQVNNPVAGVDEGLLAFLGWGWKKNKMFGFASCPRRVGAAEGTNVIVEKEKEGNFTYCLTNIEYIELAKKGIQDVPKESGSSYSIFPTNTNILFADVNAVEQAVTRCPFPGMVINFKKTAPFIDPTGRRSEVHAGRLETMMQNIAEDFTIEKDHKLTDEELKDLPVYITFYQREKTISVAKNPYRPGKEIHETPLGAWADLMRNFRECLVDFCGFKMPEWGGGEGWIGSKIPFHVLLHPSLGPPFARVGEKIRGGALELGSEWIVEIAELDAEQVFIAGSLQIIAQNPRQQGGRCELKNVRVVNEGIGDPSLDELWRNDWVREETCLIEIEGNGELFAEDVSLFGPMRIFVPRGIRMIVLQEGGKMQFQEERIK